MAICLIGVTGSWGLRRASGVDRFAICIGGWVSHGLPTGDNGGARGRRPRAPAGVALWVPVAGGWPAAPVPCRVVVALRRWGASVSRQRESNARRVQPVDRCSYVRCARGCGARRFHSGGGARGWVMRPPRCAGVLARRGARKRVQCADAAVRVCVGGGRSPLY